MSPLAGQMFFRASLFGAFGESKRWLGTNADGSPRTLQSLDFYKAGAMTGKPRVGWCKLYTVEPALKKRKAGSGERDSKDLSEGKEG
jgi:hypothetical protein